jgi:hypothetical protein
MAEKSEKKPDAESWADAFRSFVRLLPVIVPTLVLGIITVRAILAKVGHPAATLDDAYIHFQYARAIVEGHPMRYQAGEPVSSGATSQLWPAVLAPFYAIGFRGQAMMWPAWFLSFAALGGLAYESWKLARGLVSDTVALAAGAMVLAFGGHVWCAASGMEVVPFAWLLARSARRGVEWCESKDERTRATWLELGTLSVAAPLMRPEGALASVLVAIAIFANPRNAKHVHRLEALLPLVGIVITPVILLAMTGKTTTSTTQVKLAVGNPYYPLIPTFVANARILMQTILNGEVWSVEFLPKGGAKVALASLVTVAIRGVKTRKVERALAVLAFALAMFVPCAYVTFLWNRLRYLWPFAAGWFVALACLAETLGSVLGRMKRSWAIAGPMFGFGIAGMLAMRLDWVIDDAANSASGIDRQHGKIAAFAARTLPENARIGLNDTGAIAYFSGKKTFDIVGLTTPTEARYWLGGPASRFEHYERVFRESPERLPTHFAVYPEWMGTEVVLGRSLFEATVKDATILGGQTMKLMTADYTRLGSGEAARTKLAFIVDALDVADLESEALHEYELLGAKEGQQSADSFTLEGMAGREILDGARTVRRAERFVAALQPGKAHVGVVRLKAASDGDGDVTVKVRIDGKEIATVLPSTSGVTEETFTIPADVATARSAVSLEVKGGTIGTYHYWFSTEPR